jgi:hypothetical protein
MKVKAPWILDLGTRQIRLVVSFTLWPLHSPEKKTPVPTGQILYHPK